MQGNKKPRDGHCYRSDLLRTISRQACTAWRLGCKYECEITGVLTTRERSAQIRTPTQAIIVPYSDALDFVFTAIGIFSNNHFLNKKDIIFGDMQGKLKNTMGLSVEDYVLDSILVRYIV